MPAAQSLNLQDILHRIFGHREFRAHQQRVCEAAASGRDVLLVMPTGAGKSLCYQLPALARRGTALVISPLIALMDDQASKLAALNLRVARIHSGLPREDLRQACRDYLAGELDFLFIAPERMRVPGFPKMLAKRKPALIAIDEAHCISQWGHDFRPDYRTLTQHVQALRPSPVIALTATATPAVQRDIATQLGLQEPAIFITGFRRENLAVEAIELSKPQRAEYAGKLLAKKEARPAIVYAASRKSAEELAARLSAQFPAAAYHAGLESSVRERVQRDFLDGHLDVVVATVAFGMGVDKANVRTVVHVALPGSVEAYYQEIGRAGRDGLPSRTVLLYSFADRKTQEFFLERNYPPKNELERVAAALTRDDWPMEDLQRELKLDNETLARIVEKLVAQGVATVDMDGIVRGTGERGWQTGYEAQVSFRREQIDRMMAFAEGHTCRMTALVQHFGDRSDANRACGQCDVCAPGGAGSSQQQPTARERDQLRSILRALDQRSTSTGKLFTDLALTKDRKDFDRLLDGLARAALITISNDTFRTPEGRDITYRKAAITHEGRTPDDATLLTVWLCGDELPLSKGSARRTSSNSKNDAVQMVELTPARAALEQRLRAWRKAEADKAGKPAFIVFGDSVLRAIAAAHPQTLPELLRVPGIGEGKLDLYGAAVIAICREKESALSESKPAQERRVSVPRTERPSKIPAPPPTKAASPPKPATIAAPTAVAAELNPAQQELAAKLRTWRTEMAREQGLPSFFILSDSLLHNIASAEPTSLPALSIVRGFNTEKMDKFGHAVLELCRS